MAFPAYKLAVGAVGLIVAGFFAYTASLYSGDLRDQAARNADPVCASGASPNRRPGVRCSFAAVRITDSGPTNGHGMNDPYSSYDAVRLPDGSEYSVKVPEAAVVEPGTSAIAQLFGERPIALRIGGTSYPTSEDPDMQAHMRQGVLGFAGVMLLGAVFGLLAPTPGNR